MLVDCMKEKYKTMRHQHREFLLTLAKEYREQKESSLTLPLTAHNKLMCERLMFEMISYSDAGIQKTVFLIEGYCCVGNNLGVSVNSQVLSAWTSILEEKESEAKKLAEIEEEEKNYSGV